MKVLIFLVSIFISTIGFSNCTEGLRGLMKELVEDSIPLIYEGTQEQSQLASKRILDLGIGIASLDEIKVKYSLLQRLFLRYGTPRYGMEIGQINEINSAISELDREIEKAIMEICGCC